MTVPDQDMLPGGLDTSWSLALDRLDLLLERVTPDLTDGAQLPPAAPTWGAILAEHEGWHWVAGAFDLSEPELDVLLLAVATEIDERYLRLLNLVQNDVGACRPTVALILRCLVTLPHRLTARGLFRSDGPLLAQRLMSLEPDPRLIAPVFGTQLVVIDDQIRDVLLRQGGLDRRLAGVGQLTFPDPGAWSYVPLTEDERARLLGGVSSAWGQRPCRLYLRGPRGSGRAATASALAGELKVPLLTIEFEASPCDAETLRVAVREAVLQGAVLHVANADALAGGAGDAGDVMWALRRVLADHGGLTILTGSRAWSPSGSDLVGVVEISLAHLAYAGRTEQWRSEFERHGLDPGLGPELASRFRFGPGQVADAVETAITAAGGRAPERSELFAAARGRSAHHLSTLARRTEPAYGWEHLVLPEDSEGQLRDLCRRVTLGPRVWHEWGFDRTIAHGRGATALFAGPSGTGKTMAAEVVAGELGLDLFTVDLSSVMSKYIGETEKNLERIFTAAAEADAILMFDEADALFGKRSQVHDAHDRYANVETAYLLQRMERYEGVAILATNLRANLDEAFIRRLQFIVDFPFPDDERRRRIWEVCFPSGAPLDADLDLDGLAHDVRLAGGNIRNVALHSAFLAAADCAVIGTGHVRAAVRHEYRKLGRVLPESFDNPKGG